MKTEVHYAIEERLTNNWWSVQTGSKQTTIESMRRQLATWMRKDPGLELRLVRVTTTEEREVVG